MNYVYTLKSANDEYYLGSTSNLERRLIEHNSGKTKGIKYKLPAELVFSQSYENITETRNIERKLKKFKSRKILEQIITEGRIKIR